MTKDEALKLSIAKWQSYLAMRDLPDHNPSTADCPLCWKYWHNGCVDCPVQEFAGASWCHGTPYVRAAGAYKTGNKRSWRNAVREMVRFLENLEN